MHRSLVLASQVLMAAMAYIAAFALVHDFSLSADSVRSIAATLPYLLVIRAILLYRFRLERGYWKHAGLKDLLNLTVATSTGSLLFPLVLLAADQLDGFPISVFVIDWLLALAFIGGARVLTRLMHENTGAASRMGAEQRRTFIIGAGEAGEQLLRQLQHDPHQKVEVVGLIDDDDGKRNRVLHGTTVLGTADELRGLAALHRASLALIAIPSIGTRQLRRIVDRCMEAGVEVKLLPPLKDLVTSEIRLSQVRDVQIEDLLGRDEVALDMNAVHDDMAGKVVLITGAGGSIGSELARQIAQLNPLQMVLVERAESPLYFAQLSVSAMNSAVDVVAVLASVTNRERMTHVFHKYHPDVVFHAAAYKHVPLLEANTVEGVWNNVVGTLQVARCAARSGVGKFVLISTDKAVNPTSILGATKRIAERIVLELPSLRASGTDFRVVRFGNVLGSDGSVVPLFKRQLAEGGPLTVTHPEVRRFFMTIPEAVQLLLQASMMDDAAGRIALLEMGTQVRVLDLAEQLILLAGLVPHKDVEIVFTGLRPGEKLEEELVASGEQAVPTTVDKIRVVEGNGAHGESLALLLRRLVRATAQRREEALNRALTAIVPEYHPMDGAYAARHQNGTARRSNGNGGGQHSFIPVKLAANGAKATGVNSAGNGAKAAGVKAAANGVRHAAVAQLHTNGSRNGASRAASNGARHGW